jgi:choline dehydrogenase-like flavoprotein
MRDAGMQVVKGKAYMPLLQGRAVGGSTVVNSAIALRAPAEVLDQWSRQFGLRDACSAEALSAHYDALERDLSVRSVDAHVLGRNNEMFLAQAERSGFAATPMRRYDKGCKGSGRCLTGCPNAAKQGMNVTYVPWALRLGARLYASCKVQHVELRGGRAVSVRAVSSTGAPISLRARHGVLVAASTIQTPGILARSGVRSRALGRHFQMHPGLAVGAVFDAPVQMDIGASQGAQSLAFRSTHKFKLETIAMQPELAAARIPGAGIALADRLSSLGHVAVWAAQVKADAEGTVGTDLFGRQVVDYTMTQGDLEATRAAVVTLCKLMFEAGAKEVWPGVFGAELAMTNMDQVKQLETLTPSPQAFSCIASHLFGAARMGPDPRTSVCDLNFEVHGTTGLFVVDSSVFPTNLGVNPQHTIMAVARLAASSIAARARLHAAA